MLYALSQATTQSTFEARSSSASTKELLEKVRSMSLDRDYEVRKEPIASHKSSVPTSLDYFGLVMERPKFDTINVNDDTCSSLPEIRVAHSYDMKVEKSSAYGESFAACRDLEVLIPKHGHEVPYTPNIAW